jgi:hypothetical protein
MSIPTYAERQHVLGDGRDEILGFEDFAVKYVESHENDYIFIIVDENLDVESQDGKHESISGSYCMEKIRKRLTPKAERRMLALVRSANDSTSDVSLYKIRCHGFLPKAPIRREKINETLAPLWYHRFPPSEFGLCLGPDVTDEKSNSSEDVACSCADILQKLNDIDLLFEHDGHLADIRKINDLLHELKGDLLTMTGFNVSMIGILGQINLMLQTTLDPQDIKLQWQQLHSRCHKAIKELDTPQDAAVKARRNSVVQIIRNRPSKLLSSLLTQDF